LIELSLSAVGLGKDVTWSFHKHFNPSGVQADKSDSATHTHSQMPGRTVACIAALFLTLSQAHETRKETNKQKEEVQGSI